MRKKYSDATGKYTDPDEKNGFRMTEVGRSIRRRSNINIVNKDTTGRQVNITFIMSKIIIFHLKKMPAG